MTLRELLNHYHETDIYVQKVRLQENLEYQNLLKFLTDHCDLSGTKVTEIESDDHYGIFVEDNVIFLNNKYYLKLAENFLNIKFVLTYLKTEYFSNTNDMLHSPYWNSFPSVMLIVTLLREFCLVKLNLPVVETLV